MIIIAEYTNHGHLDYFYSPSIMNVFNTVLRIKRKKVKLVEL